MSIERFALSDTWLLESTPSYQCTYHIVSFRQVVRHCVGDFMTPSQLLSWSKISKYLKMEKKTFEKSLKCLMEAWKKFLMRLKRTNIKTRPRLRILQNKFIPSGTSWKGKCLSYHYAYRYCINNSCNGLVNN